MQQSNTVFHEGMIIDERTLNGLDPRHIGRFYDKEMPIDMAGMEMSKPGLPDMRRRKHSVTVPESSVDPAADNPPQTQR